MQKPDILYHASTDPDIIEFEPRNISPRYSGETDLIFATPHIGLAAMFLAPRGIPIEISIYGDRYVIFINSTEQEYALLDKGGEIYSLPTDTFETDSKNGMGEIEWFSKVPVRPLLKEVFRSSIEAMQKYGVEYYFVDDDTLKKIQDDPGNALKLVA